MNSYNSLCDDFTISMFLSSKIEMTNSRETVVNFFDSVRKMCPTLVDFERRDAGDYVLEEERDSGSYRWVSLDSTKLIAGHYNPPDLETADAQHERLLDMAPYHLGITDLDADILDLGYTFDMIYAGNHDEVVTDALATGGPLESLAKIGSAKVLNYQPCVVMVLDEACKLHCRLSVETRTTVYQLKTRNFPESPISVRFGVRQYGGKAAGKSFIESYQQMRKLIDELVAEHVVPNVLQPLARAIGAKQ